MAKRIAISAGELSGDLHASRVLRAIQKINPKIEAKGLGGPNLSAAGMELTVDLEKSAAAMGFSELFGKLGKLVDALQKMKSMLKSFKPDLLIIVDFADFNIRLAKYAKAQGIPVFYYIPPKVWAWRSSRVKAIEKYVDLSCTIFPFEKEFFDKKGVKNVVYVGHPLVDEIETRDETEDYELKRSSFLIDCGLNPEKSVIALFPGSRPGELKRHLKPICESLLKLKESKPEIQVLCSVADSISFEEFDKYLPESFQALNWFVKVQGNAQEILHYSDVGAIKSGTSNLEAALHELPFFMFFRASKSSELIVKSFVDVKEFSIVNVIRSGTVKELLQQDLNPDNVTKELNSLLSDDVRRGRMLAHFAKIRSALSFSGREENFEGARNTPERVARLALGLAGSREKSKGLYKRVFSYVRPYRTVFSLAVFAMILFGASDGVIPFLLKHVLDGVFKDENKSLLYALPVLVIAFTFVRALADFGQQYLMSKVGHNIVKDIRNQVNRHLLTLSSDYFHANSSANLLSRITSDVMLVKTLLTEAASAVLRDSVRVVALLIAAIYLDPFLAVIAFVAFPIGIYPIYKFGRKMRKLSKIGQDAIGSLSSMLHESILGQRVVKAFSRERFEIKRFEETNEVLTKTFLKSERVKALTGPVNEVLASFVISGVLLYGGISVISGGRTQGDFIAFLVAVFLLYDPFKKLSRINATVQQGIAGAQRIFDVLDQKPSIREPAVPKHLDQENSISIKSVDFSYNVDSKLVLSDINLKVKEGEKAALVGLSGAGKSTLVDLIPRFIDPRRGEVLIGSVNVKDVSFAELRSRIAVVSQHTFLFNDTIYNNIAYGNEAASYDAVIEAAKAAYAYNFITQLKDGFDTIVGEGGYTLSGGERQRISIARAILKDAPILILDEATASLDNKSEREVQYALEELEKNRTCVIIAHRLSTVQNADKIYVMKDGKIVEQGQHQQLLDLKGEYAKLYSLQFHKTEIKPERANESFVN